MLGVITACLAAFFFGVYILPRKRSGLDPVTYQLWTSLFIPTVIVIVMLFARQTPPDQPWEIATLFGCGFLWSIGATAYSVAVDDVGVTRSTPVKNLGPVLTTIYGIVVFREFSLGDPVFLSAAVGGSVLMAVAAVIVGRTTAPAKERARAFLESLSPEDRHRYSVRGYWMALLAAFCFSTYTVPLKMVINAGNTSLESLVWMALGVVPASWLAYFVRNRRLWPRYPGHSEMFRAGQTGVYWAAAGILGAAAMTMIPMSVSWPITNISSLVAMAFGIWFFKEVRVSEHRRDIALGLLGTAAGIGLLAFALTG